MTVLRSQRVVLPEAPLRVAPADVHVEGAWITHVGPPEGPCDEDLGDALLAPAFVDPHVHLALIGLRGLAVDTAADGNMVEDLFFRIESRLTREDVRAFARMGALEAVRHGTAAVWDHYYFADAVLDALRDVGLGGVVAPALQDLAGPGKDGWRDALDLTEALAAEPLAEGGHGVALGPHATDTVSDTLWAAVAGRAEALDLPVHVHVAQSPEEVARARAHGHATPLERLAATGALAAGPSWLLVHGLFLADRDLVRLDRARHTLVVCPSAQGHFGFPAAVGAWTAAGVPWTVATDAACANDAHDLRRELGLLASWRVADVAARPAAARFRATGEGADAVWADRQRLRAGRAAWTTPEGLLRRAWETTGRLHPQLPSGRVAPGHLAHLAVWDVDDATFWPGVDPLRALVFGSVGTALRGVMASGRWVRPDPDEVVAWREEAEARRRALVG